MTAHFPQFGLRLGCIGWIDSLFRTNLYWNQMRQRAGDAGEDAVSTRFEIRRCSRGRPGHETKCLLVSLPAGIEADSAS